MFRFSWLALVAAIVCLQATVIQGVPIGDDKASELKIVAAMDIESELKPSTENPKDDDQIDELPKPTDDPTDHIQVIKMDVNAGNVKEIEELEKEIVKEFHLDEKSEVVQLLPCIHEHEHEHDNDHEHEPSKMDNVEMSKAETKAETVPETIVTPKELPTETFVVQSTEQRSPRSMESEKPKEHADTLTDEDITEIVKMISFPQTDSATKDSEVEPRTTTAVDEKNDESTKTRVGRAIRNEGRGYYILAFAPVEGPVVPEYTKLDIIPIERSANGSFDDDDYEDEHDRLQSTSDDLDEGRLISSKQLSRYIRRMMKQIRKGTRKIQRKTRFKSADESEPTVENFLRKMYETRKEQQTAAPKNSWFSWNQK